MIKFKIPTDIVKEAQAYMKEVLTVLEDKGIIEDVDIAALNMLARSYSTYIKASKTLEREGLTVTSDRGNIVVHPLVKVAKDAQTQAMQIMTEFGLTAKSRTKLPKSEEDNNPLETFIKNRLEQR